jgi:hypothetical protein
MTPCRLVNTRRHFGYSCIYLIVVTVLKTALKIEAQVYFETSVTMHQSARRHDMTVHQHCSDSGALLSWLRENSKPFVGRGQRFAVRMHMLGEVSNGKK